MEVWVDLGRYKAWCNENGFEVEKYFCPQCPMYWPDEPREDDIVNVEKWHWISQCCPHTAYLCGKTYEEWVGDFLPLSLVSLEQINYFTTWD